MTPPDAEQDWSLSPARTFAAGVLAGAGFIGLVWTVATRQPGSAPRPWPTPTEAAAQEGPAAGLDVTVRVDVNAATAAELMLLPGIGPALAGRIIADRRENGPFGSVDDLDRVSGIGVRTVERLRPFVDAAP